MKFTFEHFETLVEKIQVAGLRLEMYEAGSKYILSVDSKADEDLIESIMDAAFEAIVYGDNRAEWDAIGE